MVHVELKGDDVLFTVEGWHKLWALKSELRIPSVHLRAVRHDPAAAKNLSGLRMLGTSVPGVLAAGTFYLHHQPSDNKPAFLDVRHPDNVLVVELVDEQYSQLIVEVEDPAATLRLLQPLVSPGA